MINPGKMRFRHFLKNKFFNRPLFIRKILGIFCKKPNPRVSNKNHSPEQLHLNIVCYGHVNGSYSLAAFNRAYFKALYEDQTCKVLIYPIEGSVINRINHVPQEHKAWIKKCLLSKNTLPPSCIKIFAHYPLLIPKNHNNINLALFFWEESIVPQQVIKTLNSYYDGILVATHFIKKVLIDSGFEKTITVIGSGLTFKPNFNNTPLINNNIFTFLHISSCFPRKGIDALLQAYTKEFTSKDNVNLIIKGFINPHNNSKELAQEIFKNNPNAPAIELINKDISEEQLSSLYSQANAVVLPTRGEGLNLVAAETMLCKKPLIVTAHSAHLDFCNAYNSSLIDYQYSLSKSHLKTNDSLWADPDVDELAKTMRALFDNWRINTHPPLLENQLTNAQADVTRFFNWSNVAKKTIFACKHTVAKVKHKQTLTLGWLSPWASKCGIAEYSAFILNEFDPDMTINLYSLSNTKKTSLKKNFNVFFFKKIDKNMELFINKIIHDNIDALVIQYHPAFFDISKISSFIEYFNKSKIKVIFVFHTIQFLDSLEKNVLSQLKLCDRILVHTIADMNRLKLHGLTLNATYFPHGVINQFTNKLLTAQTIDPCKQLILGSYGFFLPHKGIFQLITAFKEILNTIPNAQLMLINAEYPSTPSRLEIKRCIAYAKQLDVFHLIRWHTNFKSHSESLSLLAECDLVLFTYQKTDESSSAAVRMALASGKLVLTTPIPIFNEVKEVIYPLKGIEAKDISEGVLNFLQLPHEQHHAMAAKQQQWLIDNDWKKIATRMQGMLRGLVANS